MSQSNTDQQAIRSGYTSEKSQENREIGFWKRFLDFIKLNADLRAALLLIFIFGLALLYISRVLKELHLPLGEITHELGVLGISVTPIVFIYELALRRLFTTEMKKEMGNVLKEEKFKEVIINTIKHSLPQSYQNIFDQGIYNAYSELDPASLVARILEEEETDIKICQIFVSNINHYIKTKDIVKSIIVNKCTYRVVIYDPTNDEVPRKRVRTVGVSLEEYMNDIRNTLFFFQNVWRELKKYDAINKTEFNRKIEFRVHNDFIAGSIVGFKNYFLYGFYFHNTMSSSNLQLLIDKGLQDKESLFYIQIAEHFEIQWDIAYKSVEFHVNQGYTLVERDVAQA